MDEEQLSSPCVKTIVCDKIDTDLTIQIEINKV